MAAATVCAAGAVALVGGAMLGSHAAGQAQERRIAAAAVTRPPVVAQSRNKGKGLSTAVSSATLNPGPKPHVAKRAKKPIVMP